MVAQEDNNKDAQEDNKDNNDLILKSETLYMNSCLADMKCCNFELKAYHRDAQEDNKNLILVLKTRHRLDMYDPFH